MKKIHIILLMAASSWILWGCNDAEYGIIDNTLYISEAATSAKSATVFMEQNGADVKVNLKLAQATDADVRIPVSFDIALLERYNAANGTEYLPMPLDSTDMKQDTLVTIPAGETGVVLNIHIPYFDPQGKSYAIPISLGNVEGNVAKSTVQDKFVYLITVPLITSVPIMKGANNQRVQVGPTTPWGLKFKEWSFECWIRMAGFSQNSAFFDTPQIYIRFGDVKNPLNYINIKTWGSEYDSKQDFEPNVWYHLAFVHEGQIITCYRNGAVYFQYAPGAFSSDDKLIPFESLSMIGSGTMFANECAMSQVRLWNKSISQAQIRANMYSSIDLEKYKNDLVFFLPMNEGAGLTFADVSGNGHDATAGSSILQRWEDNVRFDK
jgi:hypothetical protein